MGRRKERWGICPRCGEWRKFRYSFTTTARSKLSKICVDCIVAKSGKKRRVWQPLTVVFKSSPAMRRKIQQV